MGGRVLFAQDHRGIRVTALQGNPDRHLAERGPRQGVGPAERLRAEVDVDAERPPLPHQAVEQERSLCASLSSSTKNSWNSSTIKRSRGSGGVPARCGSRSGPGRPRRGTGRPAQRIGGVEPLQHADPELALALDRHDARVRQFLGGVDLELNPFLEVDQVEVDLVGAVVERQVGDQGMQKRGFSRTGSSGQQDVLRGPLSQCSDVAASWPLLAERDVDPARLSLVHHRSGRGADELERNLDAAGVLGRRPRLDDQAGGELGGRGGIEGRGDSGRIRGRPRTSRPSSHERTTALRRRLVERETGRQRAVPVDDDQGQDAAGDAGRRDARQAGRRLLIEAGREVGYDQDAVRLGHFFRNGVVFFDRCILVAQVFLGHFLHVGGEVGQPLLNLPGPRSRPDW